jgi:exopolysaccharide/PEP-CTERM locus tyrosine autokinase
VADPEAQGFTEIPSNPSRPATEAAHAPGVDPIEIEPKLVIYTNPHSYEAEQFRKLRNTILFPPSGRPPQSILITSALPGEGKSFVAANLAASIAQHLDKHVLLVDGDVRRPTLHTYFGLSHTGGLTEVLQGKMSIPKSLVKTPIDRLTLLPAGHTPKNPSELLSSRKMGDLLKEITSRYSDRMVLIDSPPPQMTSETSALARQVDGILLVVRFLKSNREMTSELVAMLDRDRILGVVGNHLDIKTLSYYGKSKYTNYGHYYGR